MKSKITLIVLALFSLTTYAQSRKTYTGEYTASGSGSQISLEFTTGRATYSYYEDEEGNRLYDGSFRYDVTKNISTWDGRSTGDKIKVSVKGTYKDHLRNGDFTTTYSFTESGRTSSATCKTDYAMGYANGLWSITESGEAKSVSFVNNVGSGSFSYKTRDFSITGKMNDKGLLDGDIVFLEGKWRTTITYDKGFQISYISKNTQTGEITEREEASEEQIAYFSQISNAMQNQDTATLENIPYTFQYTRHYGIYDNYKSSFMDYNFPGATPGDLSATQDYYHSYLWDAFNIIELVEQETKDQRIAREKREAEERLALEIETLRKEINNYLNPDNWSRNDSYNNGGWGYDQDVSTTSYSEIPSENYLQALNLYIDQELFNDATLFNIIINKYVQSLVDENQENSAYATISLYQNDSMQWDDGLYDDVVNRFITSLIDQGKIDSAALIYNNESSYENEELKSQITNLLIEQNDSEILEFGPNHEATLSFIKDNKDSLDRLDDGEHSFTFNNEGQSLDEGYSALAQEHILSNIYGFQIPLNSKINFTINTKETFINKQYRSGYSKEIYHKDYIAFYKKSDELPVLTFENDSEINSKTIIEENLFEITRTASDQVLSVTEEIRRQEFPLEKAVK
tara:strand:+ start:1972 stop:3861 length:1890 start_codon:yes stop_codon:yes gene_type:complete